jgi:hypothetical protein
MKRISFAVTVAAIAVAAGLTSSVPSASAFGITGGGGRLGYLDPEGADGGFAVGAHIEMESAGSAWHLQPNILYWDADRLTGFNGNLDAFYHFGPQSATAPYLGAGLGFSMVDVSDDNGADNSQTDPAANLIGGVMFPAGRNSLFVEGRYTISEVNQASLLFGITVR